MDNKTGDGIEAYICLKPDDMAKLEADKEFLAFVSPKLLLLVRILPIIFFLSMERDSQDYMRKCP